MKQQEIRLLACDEEGTTGYRRTDMETVVNDHYVRVKKWCASCEHREVDEEGTRICKLMQLRVKGDFVCPRWQLSSGLQNAGISGGKVKHKDTKAIFLK